MVLIPLAPANSEPYKTQVAWKIFSNKADFSGKHKELVNFWRVSSGKIFILPKGEWLVKGILPDYPHIIVKHTISLASAQELPVEIIFNTAWVKFNVTLDGAPYNGQIGWNVFSAQKDLSDKQTRIADGWRVKSQTVTALKQGDYIVEVMNPDLKTMRGKAAFTLKSGDQAVVDIDMKMP